MLTLTDLLAPTYTQMLGALGRWLDKAAAQLPPDEATALPGARLAPDMFPLATQVRFTCIQALEGMGRVRDLPLPGLHAAMLEEGREAGDRPGTLADAAARIAQTVDAVAAMAADGRAVEPDAMIAHALPNGMILDLTAAHYARDWALGQFHFHLMAAYAILRQQGVPLGKADYVGHLLPHLRPGTGPGA